MYLMDWFTGFLFVLRVYDTPVSNTSKLSLTRLHRWEWWEVHAKALRSSDKQIAKSVTFGRFIVYKQKKRRTPVARISPYSRLSSANLTCSLCILSSPPVENLALVCVNCYNKLHS